MDTRKINFGAGPAQLPISVLKKIQSELLDYNGHGLSVLEMSHRSLEFQQILADTERLLRSLMRIPDNYEVLFMHGGGTGQFAALPLNLGQLSTDAEPSADYVVSGAWSQKAAKEAAKFLHVRHPFGPLEHYVNVPPVAEWNLNPNAAYLYYCANETIHGLELDLAGQLPEHVHLVADISSNILSRSIDVSKHAAIIAGTQKNLGIGGLTLVIVRKDLIGREHSRTPGVLSYANMAAHKSLYNTPCVFAVYVTKLILEWIQESGGVEQIERINWEKSRLIYETIDNSNGFYVTPVDVNYRSRMNIPFRIKDTTLETEFLKQSGAKNMISLKGHRSVGGIRASIYNAVSVEDVQLLVDFMKEFQKQNS